MSFCSISDEDDGIIDSASPYDYRIPETGYGNSTRIIENCKLCIALRIRPLALSQDSVIRSTHRWRSDPQKYRPEASRA